MLADRWSEADLVTAFATTDWQPFPRASERGPWIDLQRHPLRFRQASWLAGRAEGRLGSPWAELPLTLALRFSRDGNRTAFESAFFRRRKRLGHAVLAECCEGHGRFLDEILDGLWLISEEASWCLPAHYEHPDDDPLRAAVPSTGKPVLDLFAAETAMLLTEASWLLGAEIDAVSPRIRERIHRHVDERVIKPFVERDDWWWLSGKNNWTPWICSNVIAAACYRDLPVTHLAHLCHKAMAACDRFVDGYGEDGGCDEGPLYWNIATGALAMAIEHLHSRSGGLVDPYDDPKLRAMARYPLVMHLGWNRFANFSDCDPHLDLHRVKVWRLGERLDDPELKNLAQLAMRGFDPLAPVDPPLQGFRGGDLADMLRELWWVDPEAEVAPVLRHDRDRWLADTQVLVAHEDVEDAVGLVLAAKAGHNDENHNHNDVGHFIVMLDGVPALIDLGAEVYTKDTFSAGRYESMACGAHGHAVPMINGHLQQAGPEHGARGVGHRADAERSELVMELAACYAAEAGVELCERRLELHRGDDPRIELHDRVVVAGAQAELAMPLFSDRVIEELGPGRWFIDCGGRGLLLGTDGERVRGTIDRFSGESVGLRTEPGTVIHRLVLSTTGAHNEAAWRVVCRPMERDEV